MMSCQEYEQQISQLLDGELPEAQQADLQAHLRTCKHCADLYAEFTFLSQALRDPEPPADLTQRVMNQIREEQIIDLEEQRRRRRRPWRALAAMAACFAVILGVAWFAGPGALNRAVPTGITLSHPADNAQRALEADVPPTQAETGGETLAESDQSGQPLLLGTIKPLDLEQSQKVLALLVNSEETEAPAEETEPVCVAASKAETGEEVLTTLWIDGEDVVFTLNGEQYFKTEDAAPELQQLLDAGE